MNCNVFFSPLKGTAERMRVKSSIGGDGFSESSNALVRTRKKEDTLEDVLLIMLLII